MTVNMGEVFVTHEPCDVVIVGVIHICIHEKNLCIVKVSYFTTTITIKIIVREFEESKEQWSLFLTLHSFAICIKVRIG